MANLTSRLCGESGFEPGGLCRFSNYMITLQHVEAGFDRAAAVTRDLAALVTHTIARGISMFDGIPVHRHGKRRPATESAESTQDQRPGRGTQRAPTSSI
jgi:hypothetical protein